MNFESGSEQRNSALDALKQRQKVSQTGPVDKITHSRDAYGILEEKQRR